ncbi:putative polyvalent protein kinase domain-containing protein [Elizabethkingia meningoseptica]|uniref:putative polyvalent protein kinase domain-containing protein n=1 Tax=Elizabethkingia meningoseptica TaxID=238 RepID=UPI00037F380A|nr:hypothetical protein [Elizabethkingia meningoseptica]MBG0512368.1 hypothetical protein [Elizabethkingia meningoseptica]MDE5435731.1 hypothetical protein [Elizabethkingia meningoseptica]MDE5451159.1 hypothetical protein [Elizabethkingia meningoseptica]MDE5472756.1 hypothetical protein [Elizabethkingia meningoseptica]MDE5480347.1 hypothetical protein [Elizabethkingia meningoseptica]
MKNELQNIISGKSTVRYGDAIQKISCYLSQGTGSGETSESGKPIKSKEAALINEYCDQNNFWITNIDINSFISSGAEQRVYLFNNYKVINQYMQKTAMNCWISKPVTGHMMPLCKKRKN